MLSFLVGILMFGLTDVMAASTGLKLIESPGAVCDYTQVWILRHSGKEWDSKVPPACLTEVRCLKGGEPWEFSLVCQATGRQTCPDVRECADEHYSDEPAVTERISYLPAVTEDKENTGPDKYGRTCKYYEKSRIVRRRVGNDFDRVCASFARCVEPEEKDVFVACRPIGTTKMNGYDYTVCPQFNDCVEHEIPLEPGYTEEELAKLKARRDSQASAPRRNH